ncbi:unnamed protein product [Adineta steineri]|uniref:Uncharacterized protein n=1 Tax=Adineta steineri TaxID=433720 RepID=A0A814PZF5_9BILA|nr:unnamed protein product [Adineta steineri]
MRSFSVNTVKLSLWALTFTDMHKPRKPVQSGLRRRSSVAVHPLLVKRVIYNENCSCIKKVKYLHNRPPEEIVKNALLLLDWIKTSPDNVRKLFSNDLSQFAQKCCTTVHEQWCNLFYSTYEQISLKKHFFDKKQISSNSNNAFNAALMCGMPFRQASQIGKNEFWIEKNDEIDLLQATENSSDQLLTLSKTTSDEPMIFSSTLMEFSSDEDISLI